MAVAAVEPIIAWQAHEGRRVARVAGYDIIQCDLCGFRHVSAAARSGRARSGAPQSQHQRRDLGLSAANSDDRAWAELAYNDRLESMERLVGAQRRRLLDVGSGTGAFLKTAKARGWRVFGIESSRQASAQARKAGIEVAEGFFNAETAPGLGRFDAVHLSNVLECAPDPTAITILARDLLDQGGVLCINVPNDFSPFQIAGRAATSAERMVDRPALSPQLFRFRIGGRFAGTARPRHRRAHHEFPDGSVPDDGRRLHQGSRAGAGLS